MKLAEKILNKKVNEAGNAPETDDLVKVIMDAMQKMDKMSTSKLSQKVYSKLDSIAQDLRKGKLKESKDLSYAISQLNLNSKQKNLLKDGIDGQKKLSSTEIKEFTSLVNKIKNTVKYSTDAIGLQDIRKAL